MIKIIALMKRHEDLSHAQFGTWLEHKHPEHARALPGLMHYTVNVTASDDDAQFDGASEMWFESIATMQAAFATDMGKAAGADAAQHCRNRVRLVCHEAKLW
jgi:uncharacterized protein (TIGR02118 family)